ncbi:MAG: hypothetical protein JWL59_3557 [Chthoniobacteraceae bacterium]|nr:hypothetical protein [Chthoniobacteraceae bacterium]
MNSGATLAKAGTALSKTTASRESRRLQGWRRMRQHTRTGCLSQLERKIPVPAPALSVQETPAQLFAEPGTLNQSGKNRASYSSYAEAVGRMTPHSLLILRRRRAQKEIKAQCPVLDSVPQHVNHAPLGDLGQTLYRGTGRNQGTDTLSGRNQGTDTLSENGETGATSGTDTLSGGQESGTESGTRTESRRDRHFIGKRH